MFKNASNNGTLRKLIELPVWRCLKCRHQWTGRQKKVPARCPNCKNPNWNKPKKKASANDPSLVAV